MTQKGGKRQGAGRPLTGAKRKDSRITIRLDEDQARTLQEWAEFRGISVAEAARVGLVYVLRNLGAD